MKILVIEDEPQLLKNIQESLEKENFLIETAMDYDKAIEKVLLYEYDCILLDIMLPKGSGIDVLKTLKKSGKTDNVIIISAKDSLDDKLLGLELGADDYLTKPFHLAELTARVKAIIRRKNQNGSDLIQIQNLTLNIKERLLMINNDAVHLNRKEFDLLYYFLVNKNRLITKTALAEFVWGDHSDNADNLDFVYYQIKNLRKKLNSHNAKVKIEAVYGVGYKLTEL